MKHPTRAALLAATVAAVSLASPAHADVGGAVPGPGLCEYPGVGSSFQIMNGYGYFCDFPTEVNGSHWHCEWGGGVITANGSLGLNIMMFSATVGMQGFVGGVAGSCSWRCPDMTMAAQPNPPGAWAAHITPTKCKTIGPAPPPPWEDAPTPPPLPLPFGELPPQRALVPPAVTNPLPGNPDATDNPADRR